MAEKRNYKYWSQTEMYQLNEYLKVATPGTFPIRIAEIAKKLKRTEDSCKMKFRHIKDGTANFIADTVSPKPNVLVKQTVAEKVEAAVQRFAEAKADLYVKIPVEEFRNFDIRTLQSIILPTETCNDKEDLIKRIQKLYN